MQKLISLFKRDFGQLGHPMTREVNPGAEWVINGEGIATRKFDGTCCMLLAGILYKRYDAKNGKKPPEGFIPAQEPDPVTGHWPGWLLVGDGPQDRWHREGLENLRQLVPNLPDGTYELCGPKIGTNPEGLTQHELIKHGSEEYPTFPRSYDEIENWFKEYPRIEGVVWHHPDGRMVKIKMRDFGLKRFE